MKKLMNVKQRSADDCDTILRQYKTFIGEVGRHAREEFSAFNNIEDELDTFLFTHLGKKPRIEELWSLVKLLLNIIAWSITSRKRIFYQQRYHFYQYGC